MNNFFSFWRRFNEYFDTARPKASIQLVGYKLLSIFDEQRFPESITVTYEELMSRTKIRGKGTINEARRELKNAGLIDFTRKKNPTRYWLTTVDQEPEKTGKKTDQEPEKNRPCGLVPYTHAPAPPAPVPTPERETTHNAGANLHEVEELMNEWRKSGGAYLNESLAAELAELLDTHTLDNIKVALKRAVRAANDPRYGISFDFLLSKLAEVEKKQTKKEGNKCEQPAKDPRDTWIFSDN